MLLFPLDCLIDNVLQVNRKSFLKELHMDLSVDSIINYPQSFNSFRDTARLYNTYEAYEILRSNNLLHNKFEFQEYLVENEASYSVIVTVFVLVILSFKTSAS